MKRLDDFIQEFDKMHLLAMLHVVQARLGTQKEQPEDMAIAAAIVHRINNLQCLAAMNTVNDLQSDHRVAIRRSLAG